MAKKSWKNFFKEKKLDFLGARKASKAQKILLDFLSDSTSKIDQNDLNLFKMFLEDDNKDYKTVENILIMIKGLMVKNPSHFSIDESKNKTLRKIHKLSNNARRSDAEFCKDFFEGAMRYEINRKFKNKIDVAKENGTMLEADWKRYNDGLYHMRGEADSVVDENRLLVIKGCMVTYPDVFEENDIHLVEHCCTKAKEMSGNECDDFFLEKSLEDIVSSFEEMLEAAEISKDEKAEILASLEEIRSWQDTFIFIRGCLEAYPTSFKEAEVILKRVDKQFPEANAKETDEYQKLFVEKMAKKIVSACEKRLVCSVEGTNIVSTLRWLQGEEALIAIKGSIKKNPSAFEQPEAVLARIEHYCTIARETSSEECQDFFESEVLYGKTLEAFLESLNKADMKDEQKQDIKDLMIYMPDWGDTLIAIKGCIQEYPGVFSDDTAIISAINRKDEVKGFSEKECQVFFQNKFLSEFSYDFFNSIEEGFLEKLDGLKTRKVVKDEIKDILQYSPQWEDRCILIKGLMSKYPRGLKDDRILNQIYRVFPKLLDKSTEACLDFFEERKVATAPIILDDFLEKIDTLPIKQERKEQIKRCLNDIEEWDDALKAIRGFMEERSAMFQADKAIFLERIYTDHPQIRDERVEECKTFFKQRLARLQAVEIPEAASQRKIAAFDLKALANLDQLSLQMKSRQVVTREDVEQLFQSENIPDYDWIVRKMGSEYVLSMKASLEQTIHIRITASNGTISGINEAIDKLRLYSQGVPDEKKSKHVMLKTQTVEALLGRLEQKGVSTKEEVEHYFNQDKIPEKDWIVRKKEDCYVLSMKGAGQHIVHIRLKQSQSPLGGFEVVGDQSNTQVSITQAIESLHRHCDRLNSEGRKKHIVLCSAQEPKSSIPKNA